MLSKIEKLQAIFTEMGSVLVSFSGGVDSTLLIQVAADTLGEKAVAMTAVSPSLAGVELEEAKRLAAAVGIRHLLVEARELENPQYAANPVNRCYFCKTELFALAGRKAQELGLNFVVDGTHLDDLQEVRPGRQAAKEWSVRSPLVEAGFTKQEIRQASRDLGLPTWDKPAMACLASRFPTGTPITWERLKQVEACEAGLKRMGFRQLRARYHGEAVRLELDSAAMERLADPDFRAQVVQTCRDAGFEKVWVKRGQTPFGQLL